MEPFLEENSSLDHAAVRRHAQALRGCREIALRLWSTYPQTHQLWTSPLAMCEISPIYEAPSFTWADRADEQDEQLRMLQNMERDLSKAVQEAEAGSSQPPQQQSSSLRPGRNVVLNVPRAAAQGAGAESPELAPIRTSSRVSV